MIVDSLQFGSSNRSAVLRLWVIRHTSMNRLALTLATPLIYLGANMRWVRSELFSRGS